MTIKLTSLLLEINLATHIQTIKSLTDRLDELDLLQKTRGWNHFRHMEMTKVSKEIQSHLDSIRADLKELEVTKGYE